MKKGSNLSCKNFFSRVMQKNQGKSMGDKNTKFLSGNFLFQNKNLRSTDAFQQALSFSFFGQRDTVDSLTSSIKIKASEGRTGTTLDIADGSRILMAAYWITTAVSLNEVSISLLSKLPDAGDTIILSTQKTVNISSTTPAIVGGQFSYNSSNFSIFGKLLPLSSTGEIVTWAEATQVQIATTGNKTDSTNTVTSFTTFFGNGALSKWNSDYIAST